MRRDVQNIFRASAASLAIAFGTTACSPTVDVHGNMPAPEIVEGIKTGRSTRDQVMAMLGSPSAVTTFGNESWYYIGMRTSRLAFLEPEVLERKVLAVRFDDKGIVRQVERLDKSDGREIELVERKTPTRGKELTLLEQLLGNVGRFSGTEEDSSPTGGGPINR